MSGFRRTKVDCVLPMVIMSEFRMRTKTAIIGNTHPTLVLGGLILRTPTIWTVLQTVKWSKKCIPTKSVLENQIFQHFAEAVMDRLVELIKTSGP